MYKKSNHINRKQGSRSSNGASFRLRRHIIHILTESHVLVFHNAKIVKIPYTRVRAESFFEEK